MFSFIPSLTRSKESWLANTNKLVLENFLLIGYRGSLLGKISVDKKGGGTLVVFPVNGEWFTRGWS